MKRIASLSGLLALVFVGCGLISSPPIDNPFGLQGQQSTINLQAAYGNATATANFDDITLNSRLTPTGSGFYHMQYERNPKDTQPHSIPDAST
jgi:hypothetical protein